MEKSELGRDDGTGQNEEEILRTPVNDITGPKFGPYTSIW